MALSERDKERINLMNPVSNDVKLGDIIGELGSGEGGEINAYTKAESDAKFQQKGDYATKVQVDGKVAKADFDALASRVKALEDAGGGS